MTFRAWLTTAVLSCLALPLLPLEAGPLLVEVDHFRGQLIGRHLEVIEDPEGVLSAEDVRRAVQRGEARPVADDHFAPGIFSNSVWWLRLRLSNPSERAHPWLLELDSHFTDDVRLFDYSGGATAPPRRITTGDSLPFARRPVAVPSFVLPMITPPGDSELLLRLETQGNQRFPLRVHSVEHFREFRRSDTLSNSLFLGGLAIFLLYNILLFLAVRDAGYLWVSLIILNSGVNFLWAFGTGFQYLWPNLPALNDHLIVTIPLGFLAIVPYLRRILETPARLPIIDRLLVSFAWMALILICLYPLTPYSFYARTGMALLVPISLVFLITIALAGVIGLGLAYPAGRYYLAGVALFGLSLNLTFLFLLQGFRDSILAQNLARLFYALFCAFLSMSILFKIRVIRDNLQKLNAARSQSPTNPGTPGEPDEPEEPESSGDNSGWTITPRMERRLQMALSYLRENYRDEISREGLAAELGMNPDNLGRLFKMYTGDRIGDYVNKLRVQAAAWRLRDSDRKIAEIAEEVGFENLSTFNRVFKNIMKTTPSRFRDMAAPPEELREIG